ncbi:hypothetical protein evm_014198 [Chilo suppressalis]|nr:hypothetical protein evm_014198 [Chilo suppressalis]
MNKNKWTYKVTTWKGLRHKRNIGRPKQRWINEINDLAAWLQAVLAFSVLSRVSPLAYAVASAAKRAAVVGASLLVLRNPASPLNLAGMALAGLGVLAYNRAKIHASGHSLPLPV